MLCGAAVSCGGDWDRVSLGTVGATLPVAGDLEGVDVRIPVGRVELVPGAGSEVRLQCEVRVVKSRITGDAEPAKPRFEEHVVAEIVDGVLTVRSAHADDASPDDWSHHLTLEVPGAPAVNARIGVGHIASSLPELAGIEVNAGTGHVRIEATAVRGAIRSRVGVGNIHTTVGAAGPSGGVDLETGTGDVALRLPAEVRGSFSLSTAVGGVTVAERFGLEVERGTVAASASGVVGSGGAQHRLHCAVGSVRLQ